MLRLLLACLAASALLEGLARRLGAWSAWARGVVTWSGLLSTALALLFAAAFVFSPDTREADDLPRLLAGSVAMALLIGGGFFTAGVLADRLARRVRVPVWARHGLVLLSSVPDSLAGFVLYAVAPHPTRRRIARRAGPTSSPSWRTTTRPVRPTTNVVG